MTAYCRDCRAPIQFVHLDTGSKIPVEAIPDPKGNVAAERIQGVLAGYVIARDKPLRDGHVVFMPHKAVCKPTVKPVKVRDRPASLFDDPNDEEPPF